MEKMATITDAKISLQSDIASSSTTYDLNVTLVN